MSKTNGVMHTILGKDLSKSVVKVHYESNHSKFTLLDNNRDIDQQHVDKLVSSIKKKGQLMPIIVNEKLEVHEGQHRLKACEELGVPVGYVINVKATSKDIAIMNNTQMGWKNKDFLKHYSHYTHKNCGEYNKIKRFDQDYPLPFHTMIMLLSGMSYQGTARSGNRGPMPLFRSGDFKVVELQKAKEIAQQLVELKGIVPQLVSINRFCISFIRVSTLEHFKFELALKQMEKNHDKFIHCKNQESWDFAFVEAYNYNLKRAQGKRISIKKEGFE